MKRERERERELEKEFSYKDVCPTNFLMKPITSFYDENVKWI